MCSTCIQYSLKLSIIAYYSTCDCKNGAEMEYCGMKIFNVHVQIKHTDNLCNDVLWNVL